MEFDEKYQYKLTSKEKKEIAQNLIDYLEKDVVLTEETIKFVGDWILTGPKEKRKAFFDVWEIVLKIFQPKTRPVLFRFCKRISKNGKISSFTGRIECARLFSKGKGYLIICDTKETLGNEDLLPIDGELYDTFFPLVEVLAKAKERGGSEFSERLLTYIGEDEYIMRIDPKSMHCLKWVKNKHRKYLKPSSFHFPILPA
jgi:hypothetical protein